MRNKFSEILANKAIHNKNIFILVADISPAGKMEKFQKQNKNRFINVGVAEQSMIGAASGLALKGAKVFVYTIATFALYRPFEMIRNDLCYQNLPVTIVGMGAGTVYSTLGSTHLTQEDIAVARSIPNMRIIAPCDPLELEESINFCIKNNQGPIYLRIGKSGEKNFTSKKTEKWKFGKIRKINKGKNICILASGSIIRIAFEIKKRIKEEIGIYSVHTLKPIDHKTIKKIMKNYKIIITLEDHSVVGGLSDLVQIEAYKNNYRGKLILNSLKDEFLYCYGTHDDLLNKHNISVNKILYKIKKIYPI